MRGYSGELNLMFCARLRSAEVYTGERKKEGEEDERGEKLNAHDLLAARECVGCPWAWHSPPVLGAQLMSKKWVP